MPDWHDSLLFFNGNDEKSSIERVAPRDHHGASGISCRSPRMRRPQEDVALLEKRTRSDMLLPRLAIALVTAVWLVERALGVDLGLRQFPRSIAV